MENTRRIRLPHLYNFRDLGGYERSDGGITKWGVLYRSDNPSKLDEKEWQTLKKLGITSLIDLRSTYEVRSEPLNAPNYMEYFHCPFLKESANADDPNAEKDFLNSLSLDYTFMMSNSLENVKKIIKTLYERMEHGAVCFFCTAGKDRTGIIAALYLMLEGVCDEDIIADYCITEIYNADIIIKRIGSMPKAMRDQIPPEKLALACASKSETIKKLIDWIRQNDLLREFMGE